MKTRLFVLGFLFLIACSHPAEVQQSVEAHQQAVAALADRFHATMMAKDAPGQMALLAEDGLYCGTDPNELWNKKTLSDYISRGFADSTMTITPYTISKREIRVATDGKSAVLVDQYMMTELSPTITTRFIAHAIRHDTAWRFDFFSLGLIPVNGDLKKVSEAVTQ